MKQYTEQEIINEVQKIFDIAHQEDYCMGWENEGCIEILNNTPERVDIQISCMYGAPSPTYPVLHALSEFFDTVNINDDDHFSNGGCETCDYGSSYGYTLTVRPTNFNHLPDVLPHLLEKDIGNIVNIDYPQSKYFDSNEIARTFLKQYKEKFNYA